MKLAQKFAGTFGTGAFILVCLTVYLSALDPAEWLGSLGAALQYVFEFATGGNPSPESASLPVTISLANPLKVFQWGIVGAVAGGFLGYHLGHTMDYPKGKKQGPKKPGEKQGAQPEGEKTEGQSAQSHADKLDRLVDEAVSSGESEAQPT